MENERKRGRPATGRKRDIRMTILVSEKERQAIKRAAATEGMTVADWIMSKVK